ncbi:MAG: hypothetical protein Kow00127_11490 [Bacteroidales bacterium]
MIKKILQNTGSVILGWIAGSIINMGLVQLGHRLFPIPAISPDDMEALARVMPDLSSEHFIFPFLAHAIGTFAGALITGWVAVIHRIQLALVIGLLFFAGGVMVSFMLPAPGWFTAIDLILAYFPMAWLGGRLAQKFRKA